MGPERPAHSLPARLGAAQVVQAALAIHEEPLEVTMRTAAGPMHHEEVDHEIVDQCTMVIVDCFSADDQEEDVHGWSERVVMN